MICNVYDNDLNHELKSVQHNEYALSIGSLFRAARTEFLRAHAIVGVRSVIAEKAREIATFDHRVLQDAHDIFAAAFRRLHDDGGQLTLGESIDGQRQRYLRDWRQWLSEQIAETSRYPQLMRSAVECVVLCNTDKGYQAEHRLCSGLLAHFSAGDWMTDDTYLKAYPLAGK